ncbi:hypothetical protein H8B06_11935 [Sphingobacterium sp. DN00404]|uniref:Rpn family recombination-promoting nuclease/putative transposase n=1 Tax=Sphingobacterium micropteri TaxID=2763501 RepID=A0ABR7YQD4_9SPHI|nr:hypothetical protein [Sphingobacterium micropteri]MBD1433541.1 hypothetical protein [Sphingobacterium micropteri]
MTNKKLSKPSKQNDELLKGAFEENFADFLRFLYPNADHIFDFSKSIQFMDKELLAIVPDRDRKKGKRVADLLAKVCLKDGTEKYILLNMEIEGGRDAEFAKRIYQYNYRIWDRYDISVATIAVYTGNRDQPKPCEYNLEVLDTSIRFQYRTYHIFDHSEEELLAMDNIFAFLVVACQKALLEGKIPDEELGEDRLTIAKTLLRHDYDHDRIKNFLIFLKNFLYINDAEINRIFDEQIIELSGGTIDMGVIEVVKKQEREQGRLEERAKTAKLLREERAKAEAEKLVEKRESAIKMLQNGFDAKLISDILGLSIEEIEKLK